MEKKSKYFSHRDHHMMNILVEKVFPLLDKSNEKFKSKWLMGVIESYNDWYGFFKCKNIREHSTYVRQLVSRKRNTLKIIKSGGIEYLNSRKRPSDDMSYVMYKLGMVVNEKLIPNGRERYIIERAIWDNFNVGSLKRIYESTNPGMRTHFYFILATLYDKLTCKLCVIRPTITFYSFADLVEQYLY